MKTMNTSINNDNDDDVIRYIVTGSAAHARVGRLFRGLLEESAQDEDEEEGGVAGKSSSRATWWVDLSPSAAGGDRRVGDSRGGAAVDDGDGGCDRERDYGDDHDDSRDGNIIENGDGGGIDVVAAADDEDDDHDIDFLWENAPRNETKNLRDAAGCYSHLPFGALLDDKWALARLMGQGGGGGRGGGGGMIPILQGRIGIGNGGESSVDNRRLATLESHCFRGSDGFAVFARRVGLLPRPSLSFDDAPPSSAADTGNENVAGIAMASPATTTTRTTTDEYRHGGHGSLDCQGDAKYYDSPQYQFEDLLSRTMTTTTTATATATTKSVPMAGPPPMPSNLWVIKDANSNGAGGIWIVDESNARDFVPPDHCGYDDFRRGDCDVVDGVNDDVDVDADATSRQKNASTIPPTPPIPSPLLNPNHRYVAQRYAWPPTLYSGRKCHVRAYALLTCDGRAYLHRRAFLHVANEPFAYDNNAATSANRGEGGTVEAMRKRAKEEEAVSFDPSVHITNCCANSHDKMKFTGEICVDLEMMPSHRPRCRDHRGIHSLCHIDSNESHYDDVEISENASIIFKDCNRKDEVSSSYSSSVSTPLPLGEYLPSISASVASLASSFGPFLRGGEANRGFEYLGLDFILSSVEQEGEGKGEDISDDNNNGQRDDDEYGGISLSDLSNNYGNKSSTTERRPCRRLPVAYLLEANAPPSQDTATGLPHAEALHDEVIKDLLRMWVLPNVVADPSQSTGNDDDGDGVPSRSHCRCHSGGWRCVYTPPESTTAATASDSRAKSLILPSKAAILNRIRWALFENKASKVYEMMWNKINDSKNKASALSTSLYPSALLPGREDWNTQEHGKDATLADQFCESSSSGEKEASSFSLSHHHADEFVSFVRSQFPYYSTASAANNVNNTTRIGPRSSSNSSSATTATNNNAIFFESGGGAQVPHFVANAVASSLFYRDRSVIGRNLEKEARLALSSLLVNNINTSTTLFQRHMLHPPNKNDGDFVNDDDNHVVIMGSNASSLLDLLARRIYKSGILCQEDEIVISSENHLANVKPWLDLAATIAGGVKVKWWTVVANPTVTSATAKKNDYLTTDQNNCVTESSSCILSDLVTERTRIVAISHVSNVLGTERDIPAICALVHRITKGRGHVVVDGVAAAPHLLSSKAINASKIEEQGTPDWYIVSLHKLFGPHLGCMIGKRSAVEQMTTHSVNGTVCKEEKGVKLSSEILAKSWEYGTMNYEACCGAVALLRYVEKIGIKAYESFVITCSSQQTSNQITSESSDVPTSSSLYMNIASRCIQYVEDRLICRLLEYFQFCTPLVRIIQDVGKMKVTHDDPNGNNVLRRIPIVCFVHANISSQSIVEHCRYHGLVCRACKFLSTDRLWDELLIGDDVVRFSLAHYNTLDEIDQSVRILEMLEGWY